MELDLKAVQALLDKDAIRDAALRYARGIDRHDDAMLAAAYHADATDDHGAYIGDPAGFVRHAAQIHSANWVTHQHYVTNQTIELDGATAHCETYFLAALKRPDGVVDLVGGRYVDRMQRRNDVWAVANRACLVEWNAEVESGPVAFDASIFLQGSWGRDDISYQRPLKLDRAPRDMLNS